MNTKDCGDESDECKQFNKECKRRKCGTESHGRLEIMEFVSRQRMTPPNVKRTKAIVTLTKPLLQNIVSANTLCHEA